MALTVGSLFSGAGGLDYGLEAAGLETRWQVEWDPWDQHLLEHGWGGRWSGLPRHADIRAVEWGSVEPTDVLAGGFPCQPVSQAGLRLAQLDERWLWPEYARAIRNLRPRWVIVENVAGLLVRGIDEVLGELASLGYDAEWSCFPASALGAPHYRDRVWLVAYPALGHAADAAGGGRDGLTRIEGQEASGRGRAPEGGRALADTQGLPERPGPREGGARGGRRRPRHLGGEAGAVPHTGRPGLGRARLGTLGVSAAWLESRAPEWLRLAVADAARLGVEGDGTDWLVLPPAPALAALLGRYGAGPGAEQWSAEPGMGRMAHGVARRGDRLWALGNGVVPQVAEVIGWLVRMADERLAEVEL